MLEIVFRGWRSLAVRGVLGLLFGVIALFWPGATVRGLVLLIGAYMLGDGVAALGTLSQGPQGARHHRGALALEGFVGVAAGVVTFLWPSLSTAALLAVVAAWALVTGTLELLVARWLYPLRGSAAFAVAGFASVGLGALMIARPSLAAAGLGWTIGTYAIVFGVSTLSLAAWARGRERSLAALGEEWERVASGPARGFSR